MERLIAKYIENRCTPEELIVVLEWLKTEEGAKALSNKMDELWALKNDQDTKRLGGEADKKLTVAYSNRDRVSSISKIRRRKIFGIGAIAATVAFFLISVFIINHDIDEVELEQSLTYYDVKTNPPGVKSTIRLPDGSMVKLNSDSELKYAEDFHRIREVFLKGEAFFDVVENKEMPFVVRVNDLSVFALGTAFNINAFAEKNSVDVCLTEGKVKVEHLNRSTEVATSIVLDPGEKAMYKKTESQFFKDAFDPQFDLAWKNKTLVFDSSEFSEIRSKLERWYGVQIEIDDELTKGWQFTARFHDSTLENILKNLVFSRGLEFVINKDKVNIYLPMK
ncbi:MAG: FecR domain-containing protein [Cytophagales bacterium]|nr:FecR domain-containing protein [Cytophagales bacterium]